MRSTFKTNEELPATLSATDISKYLGISKANSYQLMNRSDFPNKVKDANRRSCCCSQDL